MAYLASAIATMRRCCDDAERSFKRKHLTPLERIQEVSHKLAWGRANAETGIQSALSVVRGFLERAEAASPAVEPMEESR